MASTSAADSQNKAKLNDIKNKITLVKMIVANCKLEETNFIYKEPYGRTAFYTKLPMVVLNQAMQHSKTIIDLRKLTAIKAILRKSLGENYKSDIHEFLYNHYVTQKKLINIEDVHNTSFSETLIEAGYMWYRLMGTDKCLLIEDPEQQGMRIKYLLRMDKYREANKKIIYVDVQKVHLYNHEEGEIINEHVFIAASPEIGVVNVSFAPIMEGTIKIDDWLENYVYPHLDTSSVLVYPENPDEYIRSIPRPEDTKKEMIDWLERHNISYRDDMLRADLYKLIKIYGKAEKICRRDEILQAKGIEVLRVPAGWSKLNFFQPVWLIPAFQRAFDTTRQEYLAKELFVNFLESINSDQWASYVARLKTTESSIFQKDMELEEVIDKIVTMSKFEDLPEADLSHQNEVQSFVDKYDCIIFEPFTSNQ